jgi:hypothetical protein
MLLGITGEKVLGTFARGCQLFLYKNNDNLNSDCKSPVPNMIKGNDLSQFICY